MEHAAHMHASSTKALRTLKRRKIRLRYSKIWSPTPPPNPYTVETAFSHKFREKVKKCEFVRCWGCASQGVGGMGGVFGRPASHPAGHLASHPASHHCFVHACLPHRPCSQDLKMMSLIHGVCGKISFPLNKAHHASGWGSRLFARVGIRT